MPSTHRPRRSTTLNGLLDWINSLGLVLKGSPAGALQADKGLTCPYCRGFVKEYDWVGPEE